MAKLSSHARRERRHKRIRKKVFGTPERPRLCVYRSLHSFYAQIVDDTKAHTIVSASTIDPEFTKLTGKRGGKSIEDVRKLAEILVQKAKEKGISKVVFDRGGFLYHGKIKAFADRCRELGLEF
ncbi:ribosomal protein L18 [Hydrogenobacter thermophilus TK-6]|uniref:Large ribosomal subunit protein uL18 n=1 Tax=Hydrogenobacter thermophilus (strain DSM 6534 / IAM 12695 / TK-6) TaxID=608538 RepID=D3DH76_HYDTT|nr:50S ribosomal protein L18 [Hydrogenobacter thermophilus]ADO45116.1 ribosomal protein L18 [Hydrogenobacter thermophilus TK-6]BAI69178.1 ribosomal protein L18 [Hydrogenobacter thermophilus TK-6]